VCSSDLYNFKPDKEDEKKKRDDEIRNASFMQYYQTMLDEEKRVVMERDGNREYTKQEELRFWRELQANAELTGKDRVQIQHTVTKLQIDVLKEEGKQRLQLDAETRRRGEELAMADVDADQQRAQQELALGNISKGQMLAMEEQFEARRYAISRAYAEARLALIDKEHDKAGYAQAALQIEEIDIRHNQRLAQINNQAAQQIQAPWMAVGKTMESSFASAMDGILLRTQSLAGAMRQMFGSILQTFVQEMVTKPLAMMAMRAVKETALYQWMAGVSATTQSAASGTITTVKGIEADAVVTANAAEAGSGAAAAVAPTPFVGPVLAAAAFAAIMALVLGSKGSIKSASGGYDIPFGVNPLTQLHSSEMVLPAKHAEVIRQLADRGGLGGGGGGGEVNVQVRGHSMGEIGRASCRERVS
jgi:phage baseplate assembly protein W